MGLQGEESFLECSQTISLRRHAQNIGKAIHNWISNIRKLQKSHSSVYRVFDVPMSRLGFPPRQTLKQGFQSNCCFGK